MAKGFSIRLSHKRLQLLRPSQPQLTLRVDMDLQVGFGKFLGMHSRHLQALHLQQMPKALLEVAIAK
jgi:hypothetical protein